MNVRMQMLISRVVDPTAVRAQKTIAQFRVRRPQPWQCRHRWEPCPVVTLARPGRHCTRCTVLETRFEGQPLHHPESMAILLPQQMENTLAELDEALWPNEAV